MELTHSDRKHAKISPSSLKSFEKCPGFKRQPEGDPHPVTVEGSIIHQALEDEKYDHLTPEQLELADYCNTYMSMQGTIHGDVLKEPTLPVMGPVFGHADQLSTLGDVADLTDFKFGWHKVDGADTNAQGQAYTLGVFNLFPDVKEVTMHFIQPRLNYVTSHTYTREDVPALEYRIRKVIAGVKNATPDDYQPCASNCIYCGRYECPAVAKVGFKVAREYAQRKDVRLAAEAKLRNEPTPASVLADLPTEFYPRAMDNPEEVAKALTIAPILQAWGKSVHVRAKEMRVKEGIEIPGWELAHKKARKSITNGGAAWDAVKDRLSPEDFAAVSTPQLGKLKELFTQTSEKGKKAADGRALETRLRERDALSGGDTDVPYLKKTK